MDPDYLAQLKNVYSIRAHLFDDLNRVSPWHALHRRLTAAKLRELIPSGSILDLASGTGLTSRELAERGCRVTMLDILPEMCTLAVQALLPEYAERVEVICGDAYSYREFSEASFDIGLIAAIVTGFIGYIEHQRFTEILTLICCQAILTVCLETRVAKTKLDKVFGSVAKDLEGDPDLRSHVRTFIARSLEVRKLGSRFMKACHERYLRDLEATVEGMAAGVLKLDLGPGGRFYSQADAIEMCRKSYRGTSLVNPEEYWHSRTGVNPSVRIASVRDQARK